MIEFHFVNHSGFILSKDNTKLAFDPWIDGLVFNNSWNLLSKHLKKLKYFEYIKLCKFYTRTSRSL